MSEESLDDWADRVITLATKAYKDLPEKYLVKQTVNQFCIGLLDKEAGQHVCVSRPDDLEGAINGVRWFQHTHKAMYSKSVRKERR